jgi:hypothetical protein
VIRGSAWSAPRHKLFLLSTISWDNLLRYKSYVDCRSLIAQRGEARDYAGSSCTLATHVVPG